MRSQLSMAVAVALLVLPILGVSAGDSVNSASPTTTTRIESLCTIPVRGYLTVRVVDENDRPIQNAIVTINGTATCVVDGVIRTGIADQSGMTDLDGYVSFGVLPTEYNVTVILPDTVQTRTIFVTQTTFPVGTFMTTMNVACVSSACTVRIQTETQPHSLSTTTSQPTSVVPTAPIPFIDLPAILIAILLGLFVVARKKRKGARALDLPDGR
jgi:hypothetical protein